MNTRVLISRSAWAIEKFFKRIFLTVTESITPSNTYANRSIEHRPPEDLHHNKDVVITKGFIKVSLYSEHRGGELYKHFLTIYIFGIRTIEVFWRTGKGNDDSFHVTGHTK